MSPYSHPPYPQYPPQPPPPPSGTNVFVWLAVFVGVGFVFVLAALVAFGVYTGAKQASAKKLASADGGASAELPQITRHVPHHADAILEGCSPADLQRIASDINDAINVGAPLYNSGNFAGCYHVYDGAAADLQRNLSPACKGPAAALQAGRDRASSRSTSGEQAWAMRDAFDGLTDVIERQE